MLGYVKDNDTAAHSVDGESFYAVIHLQPPDNASMARCDKESWQKKHTMIWTIFGQTDLHQLLYQIAKIERCGIVGAEI